MRLAALWASSFESVTSRVRAICNLDERSMGARSKIAVVCLALATLGALSIPNGLAQTARNGAIASPIGALAESLFGQRELNGSHRSLAQSRIANGFRRGLATHVQVTTPDDASAEASPAPPSESQPVAASPALKEVPAPALPGDPDPVPGDPPTPAEPAPVEPPAPVVPPAPTELPAPTEPPAPTKTPNPPPPAPAEPSPPVPVPPVPSPPSPPVPVEPTPPAAPVPTEEPIFDGDQISNFAQLQAAPKAISEVLDPLLGDELVLKMTVRDTDVRPITPTENPRAQALSPAVIAAGDEIWLATEFMLPSNFPTIDDGWMSLVSIYGEPFRGSSPWQIEVIGDNLQWTRNSTYNWDVPWKMPLVKGRWMKVLLHERFDSQGWVEMWIDDQQVTFFGPGSQNPSGHAATPRLEMATMDSSNNGGPNSAKIMQYREAGMFDTGTVYFGGLAIGASRASVEG